MRDTQESLRYLMKALYVTVGNKRYLHDLDELLKAKLVDLEPRDNETLLMLARDIADLTSGSSSSSSSSSSSPKKYW